MCRYSTAGINLATLLTAVQVAVAPAFAEVAVTTEQQTSIAVTIYNQDLALIRDTRNVSVKKGENDLAFIDVSAVIRPETALLDSNGKALDVIEQNFDFDLLTPAKLLEKSLGQIMRVTRTNPATGKDTYEDAKVLSVAGGVAVLQIGDRIETAIPGRFVYSAVPANLRARPTLVIKVNSDEAGDIPVSLSYLSRGLSWAADYVAELSPDEKTINLNGWVTLTNQSGIAYKDAKLRLVAGDVNQVIDGERSGSGDLGIQELAVFEDYKMTEQAAFEYHLYSLDRPTTLKENQTKQVAMLSAAGIPVTKHYLITNAANIQSYYSTNFGESERINATVKLKFENDEPSKLGMPLPKGTVRVYKADNAGNGVFVGEDAIDHTPKNEHVDLTLGQAFDITARVKQLSYEETSSGIYENEYEVEIKNAKKEKVTIDLREGLPGEWKILEESINHKKLDATTAAWRVDVPAEGSTTLIYKVRIDP